MVTPAIQTTHPQVIKAQKTLNATAKFWFIIMILGQLFFAYYIAKYYGGLTMEEGVGAWGKNLFITIKEGGIFANIFIVAHVFLAFVVVLGGPLQLIPSLQNKAKTFHRWNGRIYFVTAIAIAITGVGLRLTNELPGGFIGSFGQFLNAFFICTFSVLAWRSVIKKNIQAHRRWAIRSFLMVSGVYFMRLTFGFWLLVNNFTLPGSTENFDGPFDRFLVIGFTTIPLVFSELYFYAQDTNRAVGKYLMSATLFLLTLAIIAGTFMAVQVFWLPLLG